MTSEAVSVDLETYLAVAIHSVVDDHDCDVCDCVPPDVQDRRIVQRVLSALSQAGYSCERANADGSTP